MVKPFSVTLLEKPVVSGTVSNWKGERVRLKVTTITPKYMDFVRQYSRGLIDYYFICLLNSVGQLLFMALLLRLDINYHF